MSTAEIRRHWDAVARQGCLVTGAVHDVTIHHAHGGSLKDRGFHRSSGRKTSDWLVIGLVRVLHVGPAQPKWGLYPIDGADRINGLSVLEWEERYRKQADMIDELCQRLQVDLWAKARAEEKRHVPEESSVSDSLLGGVARLTQYRLKLCARGEWPVETRSEAHSVDAEFAQHMAVEIIRLREILRRRLGRAA